MGEDRREGLHDAGGEADLLRGDDPGDRERREDEDTQHEDHREEDRLRVLALRVAQFIHVDRVHLHAVIGEEVVDDQDDAPDPGPDRQDMVNIHWRRGGVALEEIRDCQPDQD